MELTSKSLKIKEIHVDGFERIVEVIEEKSGLHAIIAIQDTRLGPALGGIRAFPYQTVEEALTDVKRLASGMTSKSAAAKSGTGGGKSVIILKGPKTKELLHAFGHAVNIFEGNYICAEDVGITVEDLKYVRETTPYVVGLNAQGSSGDPSPYTSWGGFRGVQAICKAVFKTNSLKGKKVAIQGLGAVGMKLASSLFWDGCQLIVADPDLEKTRKAAVNFGAQVVSIDEILSVPCDILVPCALGGILNSKTIPALRCKAIAGLANNQLLTDEDGEALHQRKILYAPDFIINSGGLINVCAELDPQGYSPAKARDKIDELYTILLDLFTISQMTDTATYKVANQVVSDNLAKGIGKRVQQVVFHH